MIRVIAVGKMKDRRLADLAADYQRRIGNLGKLALQELRDAGKDKEARAMKDNLGSARGHQLVLAMDEHGEALDSQGFAKLLGNHGNICFLIGGPDGLGAEALDRADRSICLSKMTFTHEMARVLLLEQVYRGLSILSGRPYHRT